MAFTQVDIKNHGGVLAGRVLAVGEVHGGVKVTLGLKIIPQVIAPFIEQVLVHGILFKYGHIFLD